ncbi:MAG: translation initiation factor IF-2 [Actinomycetota bacterium]
MRVHELAKELGVSSKEILTSLEELGVGGRTASSSVPEEALPRLRATGGKAKPGVKVKRAAVEPAPKPRKKEAAPEPVAEAAPAKPESASVPASRPASGTKSAAGATPAKPGAERPAAASAEGNGKVTAVAEAEPAPAPAASALPAITLTRGATPQDVAEATGSSVADVVKTLLGLGEMASASQSLSDEALVALAHELGRDAEIVGVEDAEPEEEEEEVDESKLRPRPPVVTVMGHVDHGKTLLLDAIRSTDVVSGEYGGITQHIGAYQTRVNGREITFIDTPGHEAFTAMRARGAKVTDIAVLVVAADDGVMPQTVEALDHARAAGVPIVVAVNKVDKPEADPNRVRTQMVERGIVPTQFGGTNEFVDVSAKTRQGLEDLLETVLLVADVEDLKGNPEGRARGSVIEAHLDKGRGPVATVLVNKGTLKVGDAIVSGTASGKVRAMLDENGQQVKEAGPSKPVQILGWTSVPNAGDDVRGVEDEREARHLTQEREARSRAAEMVATRAPTLQDLMAQARDAETAELNLVIKADVKGSLGALVDALEKLPQDEVRIRVIHSGVGAITESDVDLALASRAVVIGFNVRPDAKAKEMAEKEGVDLRLYRVIYEAIDEVRQALSGLLAPGEVEAELGRAEVRATFRVPRMGVVAGCYVTSGTITRNARARLVRDGVVVYEGRVGTLRRFKDDVREVAEGYECGIGLENFQDVHEGDQIEAFEVREVARSL